MAEHNDKDLKNAEDRKRYEAAVRQMRARLDRTHLSSSARKPLEKAFQKLLSQAPSVLGGSDESNEDVDL